MTVPKSYIGVIKLFEAQPTEIKKYFEHLPKLVDGGLPYEIALAYLFSRVERAHRRALYCGITKRYSANSAMTDGIVKKEYLTREEFKKLFKNIFGKPIPNKLTVAMEHAEAMRDTGMHGKPATAANLRKAIQDVFEYAKMFNSLVDTLGGFKPFGDLRGFKGRGENMDKETTRWVLKGLGFTIK